MIRKPTVIPKYETITIKLATNSKNLAFLKRTANKAKCSVETAAKAMLSVSIEEMGQAVEKVIDDRNK